MGRARRARRIAEVAAYGGGFGVAGLGVVGALGYGVIKVEAVMARRTVGQPFEHTPEDSGTYGEGAGRPLQLLVLGDSSAAGMGTEHRSQTIGAILADGISAFSGRPAVLTNAAVVGAESSDLDLQIVNALDAVAAPDVAVILIGANDVTHRIDKSVAVRHLEGAVRRLRDAGAEVVVGTCPDLGTIQPVAQPLRALARRWSRDLAAAQTVAVVEAGGRTVSLGDLIGPEFAERPAEMFSQDRFHPSPAGYARAASALLPSVCVALGLWDDEEHIWPDRRRGEAVRPVAKAATRAVRDPGTEVSATDIGGQARGPRGRWAVVLRRVRRPFPERSGEVAPPQPPAAPEPAEGSDADASAGANRAPEPHDTSAGSGS
ncbi:MAG: SGNH/GDSL hydrolase family protein [Lapillicoccus sp.]